MKILANDGLSTKGITTLEESGFEVITTKVAQEQIENFINTHKIEAILVRSATKITKAILDNCPTLKVIGSAGVNLNTIEVDFAQTKGIRVINTTEAAAQSVAELVFAHLFNGVRFLHDANRNMPLEGDTNFNGLKKAYANGIELRGKTLGIIGLGKIGQAVAKIALGLGMRVIASDKQIGKASIRVDFYNKQFIDIKVETESIENVLRKSDFITLHTPIQSDYIIGKEEIKTMKNNVGIINAASGGVIDEVALIEALDEGKVLFAGLDVFEKEPNPEMKILMHPKISLTPHIGALTIETKKRIEKELIEKIIAQTKNN